MKNLISLVCLSLVALLANCTTGQQQQQQDQQPQRQRQQPAVSSPFRAPPTVGQRFPSQPTQPAQLPSNQSFGLNQRQQPGLPPSSAFGVAYTQNDLRTAMNELKSAESDDDKAAAKEKIKSELETQYDKFLERDQAKVDQLFDRLKKLEEQLERRREAKDRLVELKMEMLISQAEGLGWPGDGNSFGVSNFGTIGSMPMQNFQDPSAPPQPTRSLLPPSQAPNPLYTPSRKSRKGPASSRGQSNLK